MDGKDQNRQLGGMTTSEKSFYLINKCVIEMDLDQPNAATVFLGTDIDIEPKVASSSRKVKAVLEFLQTKGEDYEFFHLRGDNHLMKFNIAFEKELIDKLCEIFPNRSFQLVIEDVHHADLSNPVLVDKRLQPQPNGVVTHFDVFGKENDNWLETEEPFLFKTDFTGACYLSVSIQAVWEEPVIMLGGNSFLQKLLEDEPSKDMTLVAGNGTEFKCHKIILAGHSRAFSTMLSPSTGMLEAQSGRIQMTENSEEGIRHLLQYCYGVGLSTDEMSSDMAVELFQTAHKYELSQLESSLVDFLLGKDAKWFSPDAILELYFFVKQLDLLGRLREHLVLLMAGMKTEELRSCEVFKKLDPAATVELTCQLIDHLQKKKGLPKQADDDKMSMSVDNSDLSD